MIFELIPRLINHDEEQQQSALKKKIKPAKSAKSYISNHIGKVHYICSIINFTFHNSETQYAKKD